MFRQCVSTAASHPPFAFLSFGNLGSAPSNGWRSLYPPPLSLSLSLSRVFSLGNSRRIVLTPSRFSSSLSRILSTSHCLPCWERAIHWRIVVVDFFGRELSKERREKLKSTVRLHVDFACEEIFLAHSSGRFLPQFDFKFQNIFLKFRNIFQGRFLSLRLFGATSSKNSKKREKRRGFEGSTGATG